MSTTTVVTGTAASSGSATTGSGGEVEVTAVDQQRINTFGRMTSKMHQLEGVLYQLEQEMKKIEAAQTEVMMLDDDDFPPNGGVLYNIGEVFVTLKPSKVTDYLMQTETKLNEEISATTAQIDDIKSQLAQLKVLLYGKFGRAQINLEED
ncbi:prefoldin subunit 4 [Pelomyxa schiedti]|nr:prefoldin subunit 4 [Pelomyxa schiedti]